MAVTDEELTAIYNEANAGKSVAWSMANGCFAAMRLAMEKARKKERDAIDSGKNVMHALLCSRNEAEIAADDPRWESDFSHGELQDM